MGKVSLDLLSVGIYRGIIIPGLNRWWEMDFGQCRRDTKRKPLPFGGTNSYFEKQSLVCPAIWRFNFQQFHGSFKRLLEGLFAHSRGS